VRHARLALLDRVDLLDRRREDPLPDLFAEIGVDRPDLAERARAERPAEDEPDERLPAGDQRVAEHDRILAGHRAIVANDAALTDARREARPRLAGHRVEAQADRSAARAGLPRLAEVGAVDDAAVGAERLQHARQRLALPHVPRLAT